jgi:hypothetical protein
MISAAIAIQHGETADVDPDSGKPFQCPKPDSISVARNASFFRISPEFTENLRSNQNTEASQDQRIPVRMEPSVGLEPTTY